MASSAEPPCDRIDLGGGEMLAAEVLRGRHRLAAEGGQPGGGVVHRRRRRLRLDEPDRTLVVGLRHK